MKKNYLEKRSLRKEHNKKKRLAAQKNKINARRQQKTYRDVGSFVKGFIMDILGLAEYKEQLRSFVKERITNIRKSREMGNSRYDSLSTDGFDECLNSFGALDTEVSELTKLAAQLESSDELIEKIALVNNNLEKLGTVQVTLNDLVDKIATADEAFMKKLKSIINPAAATEITTPESSDIDFGEEEKVENNETEDRSHDDYEVDVEIPVDEKPAQEENK